MTTAAQNTTPDHDDKEIDAIQEKINAFVEKAVADGAVSSDEPIFVGINADGSITVTNTGPQFNEEENEELAPFELPDTYRDTDRTSLTDAMYSSHLESHWGF